MKYILIDEDGIVIDQAEHTAAGHAILESLGRHSAGSYIIPAFGEVE
jgi:hypothetical protein